MAYGPRPTTLVSTSRLPSREQATVRRSGCYGGSTHAFQDRHEPVHLLGGEEVIRAAGRQVRERRLVEEGRPHHAVLGQVVHDQIDELDLVRGESLAVKKFGEGFLRRTAVKANQ